MVIIIEGKNIHDEPEHVSMPDSLGKAIQEVHANANRASTDPEGAMIFVDHPDSTLTRIAIAPNTTPVAIISVHNSSPNLPPRYTVAIDADQGKIVGPLARRFPGLDGHTTNLVLNDPKK